MLANLALAGSEEAGSLTSSGEQPSAAAHPAILRSTGAGAGPAGGNAGG